MNKDTLYIVMVNGEVVGDQAWSYNNALDCIREQIMDYGETPDSIEVYELGEQRDIDFKVDIV